MPHQPTSASTSSGQELAAARQLIREGQLPEAERLLHAVLAAGPPQVEVFRLLASTAMARAAPGAAIEWLNQAASLDRNDPGVLIDLGMAYRAAERWDAARYVLERVLELTAGKDFNARLLLASVMELDRRPELALLHYFRAILDAQRADHWFDDNSTAPALRGLVRHAMSYVADGRRARFEAALAPFNQLPDQAPLQRVERALAIYLHERNEPTRDPRQHPRVLYVPDLGAAPMLDHARFEWMTILQARIAACAAEIDALLDSTSVVEGADAPPFSLARPGAMPTGDTDPPPPIERRVEIHARGAVSENAAANAPQLLAALTGAPLAQIPQFSPEVTVIVLPPTHGTAVQYGRTNAQCSALVALPGSATVEIAVGGQRRHLRAGDGVVVDTSFGVAYANAGTTSARILAFDIWHPALAPRERDALTQLIGAMVHFDTALQELA